MTSSISTFFDHLLAFLLGSLVDALQKRVVPRGMRSGKGAAER